ncbi:MAG: ABC transporter permease [bacterium]|nr:ABC transporter permease [bacterium]
MTGKPMTGYVPGAIVLWAICILFILVPLASFLAYGFLPVVDNAIVYEPTFDNFVNIVSNSSYRTTFLRTMLLAFEVSAFNFVLGYATAYFIWRRPPAWRNVLVIALAIPLLMSYIIKIYAMRGVLGTNGLLNSALLALGVADEPVSALLFNLMAVRITLSIVLLPFMVLPICVALERIAPQVLQAAADLGASEIQTFRWVILPLSLPGAIVGAMFTFVLASGDFLAPELVGGIEGFTFGRLVFSQFGLAFNWPLGAALSVLLMVVALVVISIARRLSNPRWQS